MAKQVINLDYYKKDKQPFEDMPADNVASEDLPIRIKEVEAVILNNIKSGKNKFDEVVSQFIIALQSPMRVKSEDIPNIIPTDKANKIQPIDVDDNYFGVTQDINNDQREKSNVSFVVEPNADDEVALGSVEINVKNEQDRTPTQIIPALYEKKVNVDDVATNCEFAEINTNKPPEGELIQDEMAKQVINRDNYKKDKQPFEDMPADNIASEDLTLQIKEIEKVVPNNIKHVKNTFDEVVSQFTVALQSQIRVKSEDIPNIIPNATQDSNKNQREKSNVSLVVASNEDDKVVLCSVDANVKNEQEQNENTYCGIDLPSQVNMDDISTNDATLTNVSDSSDEESTPKRSKRFTFTDSDFPDSDEARDILMSYPKPAVVESCSESESEHSSEDESYEFLRRCWNKTEPDTKIDLTRMIGIEKLPDRVMTRLRNSAHMFKPSYLKEQEDQMNEDIILENIKRLKSLKNAETSKDSKKHESIKNELKETTPRKKTDIKSNEHKRKVNVKIETSEREGKRTKRKSFARTNTKEDNLELNSTAAKTTTRRTRSMKKDNDGKNTENKCLGNINKKLDHKRKSYKKERTIFPEIEERRSKRQQKAKEKNEDTMKAPISTLKKSKPKQRTVYNVSSSRSESSKSLKKSLADDCDGPSPKRMRSHNNNINNNSINNTSPQSTPATAVKIQHVHLSAFAGKEHQLDPYVHLERYEPVQKLIRTLNSNRNILTRSQFADRRFHQACKRTREAA